MRCRNVHGIANGLTDRAIRDNSPIVTTSVTGYCTIA